MRALLVLLLAGCAVQSAPLAKTHPAQRGASTGRLAGPPPSLRPGVVKYGDVPAVRTGPPADHHHHHHK